MLQVCRYGDHFYPWSKGGSTSLRNFVAACGHCNRSKGRPHPKPRTTDSAGAPPYAIRVTRRRRLSGRA
ncbi:HNH endonuclease [Paenarthrobacter sp. NPDC089714]|uniref:HNH endonuclease n=1 Tax=Paenarthrobacter sp. NPDC089714 TaxID=3364377 RepID=UPI00380F3FE2